MKKFLTISAFAMLAFTLQANEVRTFTSSDNTKSFSATIANVSTRNGKTTVTLQTPDMKQFATTIDRFSQEDQDYIRSQEALINVRRSLSCFITETRSQPEKEEKGNGSANARKVTKTDVGFNIKLRNQSKSEVAGLQLKYQVFWKKAELQADKSAKKVDKVEVGNFDLGKFASLSEVAKATVTIPLTIDKANRAKSACSSWGPSKKQASSLVDTLNGVLVRVEKDGKTIAEYRYPSTLKEQWSTESPGGSVAK